MTRRQARPALVALCLLAPAMPAHAEPVSATYTVHVAGLTVMELGTTIDITDQTYSVELRTRLRGVAGAFGSSQNVTRVEGVWEGQAARPRRYLAEGVWRGEPRRTHLEWPAGQPIIRAMQPANEDEREPVPEAARRNTIDNLSAIAQLIRQIRREGHCNGATRVFDGRRLSEMAAATQGRDSFPPARDEWSGVALKCAFEGRFLAGLRKGEDPEAARRPQTGIAWFAQTQPGQLPLPVRVESANRWFGTVTVRLVSYGPPGQLRSASN
ncbi:DUF3108 domain-containing protein [Roseomonas xinghualingensis]|uniref:DUF3108 domain-containing protein n=1 Tax=Roseomonas xinghualingensis TaxID=2986475 RepID=UPI0021F1C894|nr:DUF3108 domain-containing protein [Roseomonas sp. SXEYE001]MCV4207384.1 DUF3108 domain-containing protein [Roseomonas sp. SXEYE001]